VNVDAKNRATAKLGLYVHWPYCARICPYCDFNVRRDRGQDTDFLVEAMVADIHGWHGRLDTPKPLSSISFGGGTPSRLTAQQLREILAAAETSFGFAPAIEISLEANPTDQHDERYGQFAALGVNRLSLGIQSLDDHELMFLGRDHTTQSALAALEMAQQKFAVVSADFIYGLPEQTVGTWHTSLDKIVGLGLDHLSLYCLTIEPGTAFAKQQQRGQLHVPNDDKTADLYACTQELTTAGGLLAYEISNHCRTKALRSAHNLLYWQGDDWIGIGPGAHGRVQIGGSRQAIPNHRNPKQYAQAVQQTGWGVITPESLSPSDDLAERLMLGLRLTHGIDLDVMQMRAGCTLDASRLQQACADRQIGLSGTVLQTRSPLLVDRIAFLLLV